ncbi:MAG: transposase [Lachnospiraceae bacterium]|nr:transposase [Lachnospiraceae bacterium]
MAKNQKKYIPNFKQQIVDLYGNGDYSISQLESEYGVVKSKVSENETISLKEYKDLKKKMRELEIENEILKKLPPYSQKINKGIHAIYKKLSAFIYYNATLQLFEIKDAT